MRRPPDAARVSVSQDTPLVIWRFCDGKRGHENQTLGLVEALEGRVPIRSVDYSLRKSGVRPPEGNPHILLGAGHRTHGPLARARRRTGARAVVLMKPSFGRRRFDLCVVPEHDGLAPDARTFVTRGVLNRMRADAERVPGSGVIAIGGPSKHHDWLGAEIVAQLEAIINADDSRSWVITNSRRTPEATWRTIMGLASSRVVCQDWRSQPDGWLVQTLSTTECAWVSEDSVSMVYEALSAGAAVGLLAVPRRTGGRVVRGVANLIGDGSVTPFGFWRSGTSLKALDPPLNEADRVADWIEEQWLTVA